MNEWKPLTAGSRPGTASGTRTPSGAARAPWEETDYRKVEVRTTGNIGAMLWVLLGRY